MSYVIFNFLGQNGGLGKKCYYHKVYKVAPVHTIKMAMDDLLKDAKVIRLECSADHMRSVIQKRLDFAERQCGVEPGSLVQVTDSAYQAIADVTQASQGLALEVMKMVMPSAEQMAQNRPYIITEDHIKKLGLTYEALCEYWNGPLRGVTVIHVKPWYEQE